MKREQSQRQKALNKLDSQVARDEHLKKETGIGNIREVRKIYDRKWKGLVTMLAILEYEGADMDKVLDSIFDVLGKPIEGK